MHAANVLISDSESEHASDAAEDDFLITAESASDQSDCSVSCSAESDADSPPPAKRGKKVLCRDA